MLLLDFLDLGIAHVPLVHPIDCDYFYLALAHTATVAGLPRKAATYESPPPPAYSWTGFYIGATIGGGWSDSDVNYVANDLVSLSHFTNLGGRPPPASIETSGVLGGLQVGYNWQVSPVLLIGAEADFNWSGVKGTDSTGGAINIINAPFANTVEEKVKWLGTARARLGYLPTPNLLTFVNGGFAYGEVERSGAYALTAAVTGILVPVGYDRLEPANEIAAAAAVGLVANTDVLVIVAAGGPEPAIVAMKETKKQEPDLQLRKPVVFTTVANPVKSKLVDDLQRPGRNLTGMWGKTSELDLSRMELLNAIAPAKKGKQRWLGVLTRQGRPVGDYQFKELKDRADVLGLKLRREKVETEAEIKEAFETFRDDENIAGIVVTADSFFNNRRQRVVEYAEDAGLYTIYQWREFVDAGGLISYGPSILEAYQMAGVYVARILAGEKPWDMACSEPSGFELVMNPITAGKLGIKVPSSITIGDIEIPVTQ